MKGADPGLGSSGDAGPADRLDQESHRGFLTTFTNSLRLNSPSISSRSKYCCLELYSSVVYKMLLHLIFTDSSFEG